MRFFKNQEAIEFTIGIDIDNVYLNPLREKDKNIIFLSFIKAMLIK